VNLYSIDTGINGNMLSGNYFDMNKDHLHGDLYKMYIGNQMKKVEHKTLTLKPIKDKPTNQSDDDDADL
jgi:hypothetical protein